MHVFTYVYVCASLLAYIVTVPVVLDVNAPHAYVHRMLHTHNDMDMTMHMMYTIHSHTIRMMHTINMTMHISR